MMPPESPYLYSNIRFKGQERPAALVLATDIAVVLGESKGEKPPSLVEYEEKTLAALTNPENAALVRNGLHSGYQVDIPIGEHWYAHGTVLESDSGQLLYRLHYELV